MNMVSPKEPTTILYTEISDPNEYVSEDTFEWCQKALRDQGYTVPFVVGDGSKTAEYEDAYLYVRSCSCKAWTDSSRRLREKIREHWESDKPNEPELRRAHRPRGAYDWVPEGERDCDTESEEEVSVDGISSSESDMGHESSVHSDSEG